MPRRESKDGVRRVRVLELHYTTERSHIKISRTPGDRVASKRPFECFILDFRWRPDVL